MNHSIGHKIFALALLVLVLMAAVAAYSVALTAQISRDLNMIATKQLPLSETIGRINVRVLEQGILIQRLFSAHHIQQDTMARVVALNTEIEENFAQAYRLLDEEAALEHPPETVAALRASTEEVEREYRFYEEQGEALLALIESGEEAAFQAQLPDFNRLQLAVDREITALHRTMEQDADDAVRKADENERFLLFFNAGMTSLAAIMGLGLAAAITLILVRNVRHLMHAAERVEQGALDIEVPVATRDEVGRLGGSFNKMVDGLRMKERIKAVFGTYMDPRIVNRLLADPAFTRIGGERQEMTIMFIDLQGYTTLSESLAPDDLVDLLNRFLSRMTDALAQHNGVINDFQGDAVMSYWGPPFTGAHEHGVLACKAALAAVENFERFREDVSRTFGDKVDPSDLNMRIGVSSGPVVAGNIGSDASRKFSVIGDAVNLGARLEGANKAYGTQILVSEGTRALLAESKRLRELDLIRVKGKMEPTRIFELMAEPAGRSDVASALSAYRAQSWDQAEKLFTVCQDQAPQDPVPRMFLDRIAHLRANPPSLDWDGVWVFDTK